MPHVTTAKTAIVLLSALLSLACGAAPKPYRTPDHWQKTGYVWPVEGEERAGAWVRSSNSGPPQGPDPQRTDLEPPPSSSRRLSPIPPRSTTSLSGRRCLARLRELRVPFVTVAQLKGVENPVEIRGRLGGVTFYAVDGRALQMDCRLAVTLQELEPVFRQAGVTKIRYSGAYSYRATRSGRLSHHAHGLAIDLHDFDFGSQTLTVKRDFKKGLGCGGRGSKLNGLSCALRARAVFQELLTPDYNSDHRDHLHIAVPRRDQLAR